MSLVRVVFFFLFNILLILWTQTFKSRGKTLQTWRTSQENLNNIFKQSFCGFYSLEKVSLCIQSSGKANTNYLVHKNVCFFNDSKFVIYTVTCVT